MHDGTSHGLAPLPKQVVPDGGGFKGQEIPTPTELQPETMRHSSASSRCPDALTAAPSAATTPPSKLSPLRYSQTGRMGAFYSSDEATSPALDTANGGSWSGEAPDRTRFDHALAIVGTMCAREDVADAMARGCTRDIKAAQEASSKATMRLLKVEARNG